MSVTEPRGPRAFDPVVLGHRETEAWAAYYRHEWVRLLRASVGMVATGFGMGPWRTLLGAWYVLRANQLWAPVPDNDPEGARECMRRFYALVTKQGSVRLDPARAAEMEVRWWRLHRARQREPVPRHADRVEHPDRADLVGALVDLFAYVYGADRSAVLAAAEKRVEAMDYSDAWVAAGCDRTDPLLAAERRALVASYAALLAAVEPAEDTPDGDPVERPLRADHPPKVQ